MFKYLYFNKFMVLNDYLNYIIHNLNSYYIIFMLTFFKIIDVDHVIIFMIIKSNI